MERLLLEHWMFLFEEKHCYVVGFAMVPGGRREENDRRRRPSKASGYALDDAKNLPSKISSEDALRGKEST